MATTARLDLSVWRNDGVYEFPIRVIGPNLTGVPLRAQVRLGPDTPGAALISLDQVSNGNAEGVRLAGVTQVDGVWHNDVRIRLNQSSRKALPYSGEIGDSALLGWAFQIAGRTRIQGDVRILAHIMDSDDAPLARPAAYGMSAARSSFPASGATLTIAADSVAELVIDGADLVGNMVEEAKGEAEEAASSSASAGVARDGAETAAAVAAGFVDGIQYPDVASGLAGTQDGRTFTVTGDGTNTYATLYRRQGNAAKNIATIASSAPVVVDAATFAVSEAGARSDGVVPDAGATVPPNAIVQKRYTGGPLRLGDVPRDHNRSIAGAVVAFEDMCTLRRLPNTSNALDNGFFRMGELGDSITKGSQINLDDSLGSMDARALDGVLPAAIAYEVVSFGIPGRSGHDFIRPDYKAAAAVVDSSTQFKFPEIRIRMRNFYDWKGGTQAGLTWPQHVFLPANKPHLLVNRLGENSWPESLRNFATDLRAGIALVQAEGGIDLALQTPILPTRADPAYAAQEKPLRAIASVMRSVAKQYDLSLFDAQRLQDIWRDGVDTVDMLTVKGQDIVQPDWVTPAGFTPPVWGGGYPTFTASGMIVRTDLIAKNGRQLVTVVANAANAYAGVAWRVDASNYQKRYVFDVVGDANPQARFYYQDPDLPGGQVVIGSYAIAAGQDGYYDLAPEFEDGRVILVVNGVALDTIYHDYNHDWGNLGLVGGGGGRVVGYQTWTSWPRPATFQQLKDSYLFGEGSIGTFGVNCYVSGDAEHHPHANALKLIIHAAEQRFFALVASMARYPAGPMTMEPILVTDNSTVLGPTDYLDVTVNGSAASGSQIVGADGDAAISGSRRIEVTNPAIPVAVKVRKSGADYLTASVTVPTKGWWRFDVDAEYSTAPTRAQMLVVATRFRKS